MSKTEPMKDARFEPTFSAPVPGDFTLTYGPWVRVLYGSFFTLIGSGLAFVGWHLFEKTSLLYFVFVAGGLSLTTAAWVNLTRTRLEKKGDRLTYQNLFFTRSLSVSEIAGFRFIPKTGYVVSALPGAGKKNLSVSPKLANISQFKEWAEKTLPNEDAKAEKTEDEAALQALGGGDAPARYAQIKREWRWIQLTCFAIAAIIWLVPYSAVLILSVLAPAVVLAYMARYRGVIRLDGARTGGSPKAGQALIFLFMAAGVRGLADFHLISYSTVFVPSFAGAALITGLLTRLGGRSSTAALLPYFLFAAFYSFGLVIEANGRFDSSAPEVFTSHVLSKRIVSGKHRSYNLRLEPWGPVTEPYELDVGPTLFERIGARDAIEMQLNRGALGLPWYTYRAVR